MRTGGSFFLGFYTRPVGKKEMAGPGSNLTDTGIMRRKRYPPYDRCLEIMAAAKERFPLRVAEPAGGVG